MNTHQVHGQTGSEDMIAEEAIAWLICWRETASAPENPYRDPSVRSGAFFNWLKRSPAHLRIFMEFMELERRVGRLDASAFADIQRLIELHAANTAPPAGQESPALEALVVVSDAAAAAQESTASQLAARPKFPPTLKWAILGALAAGCAAIAIVACLFATGPQIYSTQVGEQQRQVLRDGSVIQLNTNSQVEVYFSRRARRVRLVRGEAFFVVAHHPQWPFTVTSNDGSVRALGTDFDVRQTSRSTEVAVVSGTVQATATPRVGNVFAGALESLAQSVKASATTYAAERLSGGQMASISEGKVSRVVNVDINGALSWRQKRLVFDQASLADIASEFNRYNHVQIRVEGTAAQDTRLSAIFDTDGYQNFLRYVRKKNYLSVTQEGNDWVIRSRQ